MIRLTTVRLAFGVLIVALALVFAAFPFDDGPKRDDLHGADAAIVFTGDHARVHAGLSLLAKGAVSRLFISGANPDSGIWLDSFKADFARDQPALHRLVDCCVEFGERANTTIQNALETRCWLDAAGARGAVVLVTSTHHMARSQAVANYIFGDRPILPHRVAGAPMRRHEELRLRFEEFFKYLGTLVAVRIPRSLVADLYGDFLRGCP